ncbi:MAG: hypothetical protein DMF71_13240 [Acidobacteria bacterium]|nr:MAG: hypothetical protein DMF71_13240 [Acidobacteriota bacterium]
MLKYNEQRVVVVTARTFANTFALLCVEGSLNAKVAKDFAKVRKAEALFNVSNPLEPHIYPATFTE